MQHRIAELMTTSGVQFGTSGARGLVSQMTPEICYAYTQAFWKVAGNGREVLLGHDLRPSSPSIAGACARAFRDSGIKVHFAGALPTPAIAYSAMREGMPAIVVTGSHIPFDRNGIKFYRAGGEITKADEIAIRDTVVDLPASLEPVAPGNVDPGIRQAYVDRYVGFMSEGALEGKRIAIYEHSSVARDVLRDILEALGAVVISLGRSEQFVPIDTEAVRPEDIAQARAWAREHGFDLLVSTDGDGDRPLVADELGEWFRGDVLGPLCARFLSSRCVVTPVSSNTVVERSGWFEQVTRTRIGSPYVIESMEQEILGGRKPVSGYEANGGFLLGTAVTVNGRTLTPLPTRDAVLPMLSVLGLATSIGCPASGLLRQLPQRYTHSDRIPGMTTETSRTLIGRLAADTAFAIRLMAPNASAVDAICDVDGLRLTFTEGDIVHLRPSGNAPELRCYAESSSAEQAQALCDGCLKRIRDEVA